MTRAMGAKSPTAHSTKTLMEKLGVRNESEVVVLNLDDPEFLAQLSRLSPLVRTQDARGVDFIFCFVENKAGLAVLKSLRRRIRPNGAIWVTFPKGQESIRLTDVIRAAKSSGLVDTKVVSFSSTDTALKLVIPLAKRTK